MTRSDVPSPSVPEQVPSPEAVPREPSAGPGHAIPDWLDALAARAHHVDGQPPFSDQSLVELADGERELIAIGREAAAIFLQGSTAAEAEFVVDPEVRRRGLGERLLSDLLERAEDTLIVWAHGDHPGARVLARRHGFTPVRTLLQLRAQVAGRDARPLRVLPGNPGRPPQGPDTSDGRHTPDDPGELRQGPGTNNGEPLPDDPGRPPDDSGRPSHETTAKGTPKGTVTAFRPGIDDAEWLALNAAAFASHPEQGKLTQHDLDARMAESWFDADDFLLLRDADNVLAGFCWLKVVGGLGEFYVVGVAPGRQGEGLGNALVAAGLARLAGRGIREAALYVEADNVPAVRLYRSFGFNDYTVDVQYARHD